MSLKEVAVPFEANWESLKKYEVPDWYQDAKFGIFIHWGIYSVPAFGGEWYPREMYQKETTQYEHHLETYGDHKDFGYKHFIPQFKAEKFDATAWAELFKRAGARYVVPVAEHHDGFAMYDTKLSDWNAAKMGPNRDVLKELSEAFKEKDLILGVSSHRAEHWWFFDGGKKFDSDVQDPRFESLYGPAQPANSDLGDPKQPGPDKAFLDDWLARCCELVDAYRPKVFWFDWWIENDAFKPYLPQFAAYYYNRAAEWGEEVAINYKKEAFPEGTAVFDIERGHLTDIKPFFWQTDTAVGKNSWGYIEGMEYKTPKSLIHDLADIVSKNGCCLLNIGPRPDGTIPEEEQAILLEIGKWLEVNGEAIYGSRPWKTYGEGPTDVVGGSFNDVSRKEFTDRDFRFTVKGDTLFAAALGIPDNDLMTIRSLSANLKLYTHEIENVTLLGSTGKLEWTRDDFGLNVKLPTRKPCEHALTIKIEKKR